MIVKVQIHGGASAPATITNEKQVLLRLQATRPLLARMRGRLRAYFHADVAKHNIDLGDEAPAQAW